MEKGRSSEHHYIKLPSSLTFLPCLIPLNIPEIKLIYSVLLYCSILHYKLLNHTTKCNAMPCHRTLYHETWYQSALCLLNYIPERAHMWDSNLHYYQSMITIIVAVLLIHVFGRKSKSYPGVQCDVSHLRVYTQTDVEHGWQIISLQRAFYLTHAVTIFLLSEAVLMTSLSGSDSAFIIYSMCVCVH